MTRPECAPHGPRRLVARIPGDVHGLVLDSSSGEWSDLSAASVRRTTPEAERPAKTRWGPVAERIQERDHAVVEPVIEVVPPRVGHDDDEASRRSAPLGSRRPLRPGVTIARLTWIRAVARREREVVEDHVAGRDDVPRADQGAAAGLAEHELEAGILGIGKECCDGAHPAEGDFGGVGDLLPFVDADEFEFTGRSDPDALTRAKRRMEDTRRRFHGRDLALYGDAAALPERGVEDHVLHAAAG